MINIAWGIPVIRDIDPNVYRSHMAVAVYTMRNKVADITGISMPKWCHIVKARNQICEVVKDGDFDYLFFIAQDIICPPDVIETLIKDDKDIVGGLYFLKGAPFSPVAFRDKGDSMRSKRYKRVTDYREGLHKIEFSGMDCILIKADVLRELSYPWFKLEGVDGTEDGFFCRKVIGYGYDIFVDTRVKLGHLGERRVFNEAVYNQYKREFFITTKGVK